MSQSVGNVSHHDKPLRFGPQVRSNELKGGFTVNYIVWAPAAVQHSAEVHLLLFRSWPSGEPDERVRMQALPPYGRNPHTMCETSSEFFTATIEPDRLGSLPGSLYMFQISCETFTSPLLPDPASRFQPFGVHGPSQLVILPKLSSSGELDRCYWRKSEHDLPNGPTEQRGMSGVVLYEVHVGTATATGTFKALQDHLPHIMELGVDAIEIMPVVEYPGSRGWGYDGVDLWAPSHNYGRPEDLREFVQACHKHNLAVVLDMVYNHLGPAGNYLGHWGPDSWFDTNDMTPWGPALNVNIRCDAEEANEARAQKRVADAHHVRSFILQNAAYWVAEYGIDGLRLDATHWIGERATSANDPQHVVGMLVRELAARFAGKRPRVFIEDERNDIGVLKSWNVDGVWADDFHHLVRVLTAHDSDGYYKHFNPSSIQNIVDCINQGWFYVGQQVRNESPGETRGTWPGVSTIHDLAHFVLCIQNHDQVGNRAFGDRLHETIQGWPVYRAASALLCLLPHSILLFQGQEWAASTPFLFFTDHDADLGKSVTEGRRKEFSRFASFTDASASLIPDPQDEETFKKSKLDWSETRDPKRAGILSLYKDLLSRHRRALIEMTRNQDTKFRAKVVSKTTLALCYTAERETVILLVRLSPMENATIEDVAIDKIVERTSCADIGEWHIQMHTQQGAFAVGEEHVIEWVPQEKNLLRLTCAVAVLLWRRY